jgi:NTE family protein
LEQIALQTGTVRKLWKLADPTIPRQGLFQGDRLFSFFEQHFQESTFSDLHIPLTLIAVDLNSGQEVHLREGSLAKAVRATISVPGLLAPLEQNGQRLVDGGLLNNVPVDVVCEMGADVTLAVDVNTLNGKPSIWQDLSKRRIFAGTIGGLVAVLGDSLDLLIHQQYVNKMYNHPPDFLIQPDIPADITIVTGYHRSSELISLGEKAMVTRLPDLQAALMLE